ncbi:SMI1/KNR4 family protein [Megamonas funiformis]|uniref:SMI1/KNR4 family protein n=1 Tax=Megamonas funiformis TaxID=437897 RepID=UPI0028A1CECA|nr:SMI1/KNR4 family protein [Megamonas funiformis]
MNKEILIELINKNKKDIFFSGGIKDTAIDKIECELNTILPDDYKWFLKTFGAGKIKEFKVFGEDNNNTLSTIKMTNIFRKKKLPKNLIVIGFNSEDEIYCLDTSKMIKKICPVVVWRKSTLKSYEFDINFIYFLYEKIKIICATTKDIIKIIKEDTSDSSMFTGGVDTDKIYYIENELDVKLPNSYKWFLKTFGYGFIYGIEILGYGKFTPPLVVTKTLDYRKYGLPNEYVVIEDCDEFIYCLDTSKMENNECPVISWDMQDLILFEEKNFIRFFFRELLNMQDN